MQLLFLFPWSVWRDTSDWLLIMEVSVFKNLTVDGLAAHLSGSCVSDGAITSLRDHGVSGRALLLLDRQELKEILPKIGDLAIVRDVLSKIKDDTSQVIMNSWCILYAAGKLLLHNIPAAHILYTILILS